MKNLVFEGVLELESVDDGGQARIATLEGDPIFVRVQSWDETCQHAEFLKYEGKKVRLTLEVLQ